MIPTQMLFLCDVSLALALPFNVKLSYEVWPDSHTDFSGVFSKIQTPHKYKLRIYMVNVTRSLCF